MASKVNINLFKAFAEVYECRNMSMAAKRLGISQPTVSYTINELEKQLNTTLFLPARRGVIVTLEAHKLYPHIHKALNTLINAEKILTQDIIKQRRTSLRLCLILFSKFSKTR